VLGELRSRIYCQLRTTIAAFQDGHAAREIRELQKLDDLISEFTARSRGLFPIDDEPTDPDAGAAANFLRAGGA
jgi:hypothetical protein